MANGVEGAGYWLPSEFLTDDDFLIDKKNFNNTRNTADFSFPTEFPYGFQSHADHLLQKFCAMPQSTLANLRSDGWSNNGGTQYDSVEDLMCLAKLKLNACPPPTNLSSQFHKRPEILNTSFENIGPRAVRGVGHVAWAPHQGRATLDGSGAAAKKVCAGTGVFLPRRYDAVNDLAPRRRPVCSASSPFHGRETAQIHTKPLMYSFIESRPQPKISRGFVSDHNSVLARRHALVLLQRHRSFLTPVAADHLCLPPEWTY